MTLNEIAYFIAGRLNRANDYTFIAEVKFAVKYYRALLLRRDAERNKDNINFVQSFVTELIMVDEADNCLTTLDCPVLRTKNKVPKPIRTKDNIPFTYVGIIDRKLPFSYIERHFLGDIEYSRFTKTATRYSHENGFLYIYNETLIEYILVVGMFENPEDAVNNCVNDSRCTNDNTEFPLAADMIQIIITGLLSGEFNIQPTDINQVDFEKG